MQTGTALIAPEGFHSLESGLTYYFLRSLPSVEVVHLLLFSNNKQGPLVHLCSLPRDHFETALSGKFVIKDPEQTLPCFLTPRQGQELSTLDWMNSNRGKKRSDQERAQKRLLQITPLLERQQEILCAKNPIREINRYAQSEGLNAQRIRLWFLSYLCFGQREWVLAPRYFNCGRWDRQSHLGTAKLGRKSSLRGAHSGKRLNTEEISMILESYKKFRTPGRTMTSIYREAMARTFKAKVITVQKNRKRFISPDGYTLPTIDQYRYRVNKVFGKDEVRKLRFGETWHRRRNAQFQGSFTSSVSNVFERVEADAYYCEDRPKGYNGSEVLPPVCVTRIVDTASGIRLGIGFSFNAENSESYQAAQFCSAISKKKFCSLFGIDIEEDQWPSQGISPHLISDRGPGIKREYGARAAPLGGAVIREMTPSHQGQSKSLVESAQRRVTQTEGAPRHLLSNLSPYQMAVREIRRLIAENHAADATDRLTPEMIRRGVPANPIGVYHFLNSRARNDGVAIAFDDAVRRFLKKVEVTVHRKGVMLHAQRYNSEELRQTGLLNRTGHSGVQRLNAFVFPFCIRFIWLEVGHTLIELSAELNLRDDEEQLYRSYVELVEEGQLLKQSQAEQRMHANVATVEQIGEFERETKGRWYPQRATSRLPSSRAQKSQSEVQAIATVLTGKDYD